MGNRIILFDTSVFIDHLRTGRHQERIATVTGRIRHSTVVLAELLRGAKKPAERDFVEALARNSLLLTPSEGAWLESGRLLTRLSAEKGFSPEKLRDLHFDVLIVLTALSHGATVISSNRTDFEMIRRYKRFELEIW
ncbi:MAG: PIN domain-containing protein [Deltaproteobacteria bacterium]|nr:PIN domain-containing protein [Deltaproteobacteria bacterium]